MKKFLVVMGGIVAIIMIATLLLPIPRAAANVPAAPTNLEDGGGVISTDSVPEWQSYGKHEWTDAEMAAAKPYPLDLTSSRPGMSGPSEEFLAELASKTPGTLSAGLPETMRSLPLGGDALPSLSNVTGGYSYPAPFTRYTDYSQYKKNWPQIAIGKLFFYQYGYAYVCSAASIGGYAVWTAGHCVHAGDGSSAGWSYNVIFVPAYQNGKSQVGKWLASSLTTMTAWASNGNLAYDYGGAVLYTVSRKKISQKVGWLGFAYNQAVQQHWFAIGYPAAYPFYGTQQVVCAASYAYSDTSMSPATNGIGCDQTGGTSGGPWIWQYGTNYYLNGNQSYRYSSNSSELYSPYFGDGAYSLWYALVTDYP